MTQIASPTSRWIVWIYIALVGWGVYQAVGATGMFSGHANPLDFRRLVIVLGCSFAFLALWSIGLLGQRSRDDVTISAPIEETTNSANMIGLSTALVAWAMWWGAVRFESVAVPLGMVSAVLFAICAIASLVGLSDPRPISGRWMGFASLVLFLAAIAVFVGKLWIHTRSGS